MDYANDPLVLCHSCFEGWGTGAGLNDGSPEVSSSSLPTPVTHHSDSARALARFTPFGHHVSILPLLIFLTPQILPGPLMLRITCLSAICLMFLYSVFSETSVSADEPGKGSQAKIELRDGTWKDVEALIAKHKGKIVVVDIWSTSCLPCMTEFPNLVQLHNAHRDDVVCISFNVDYVGIKKKPAETYRPRVEQFLAKEKSECINLLCTDPSDKVFEALELSSIPAVYVYDRAGKLAKRFDDSLLEDNEEEAFTYKDDINPFLKDLLSKK
jgi:thiol-disulfide isomerase/thioredoxin